MHVHANMHTTCICKNVILIVALFEFIFNVFGLYSGFLIYIYIGEIYKKISNVYIIYIYSISITVLEGN